MYVYVRQSYSKVYDTVILIMAQLIVEGDFEQLSVYVVYYVGTGAVLGASAALLIGCR